jgi:hypothetical protein
MEINYCLKKGKGKGNLYLPSFVVTLFCRRALMSSRSYVAALLCRRALMSPRSYVARALFAARFCRDLVIVRVCCRYTRVEYDTFSTTYNFHHFHYQHSLLLFFK